MVTSNWKSGSSVKLVANGWEMTVVGYDSVGSVICEWGDGEVYAKPRDYFTPSLLTSIDRTDQSRQAHDLGTAVDSCGQPL